MTHLLLSLLAVASLGPSPVSDQQTRARADGDPRLRDVYVSVLDRQGAPVAGLTAADFTVREDGTAREVLKAGPATAPLQIALLVDDSQAATSSIQPLREGLNAFVDAMLASGRTEIALITFGERPTSAVEYTSSATQLKRGINRLFAKQGGGAYLLDGIVDASRGLAKREAARPAIVALTFEAGIEFSNRHYQQVLEELEKSGASLHVLSIGSPSGSNTDEMRNRNLVIAEGTQRSGGRRDQLLADSAIPDKLKQVAADLSNQYVVSYGRPETLIPPQRIEVSVTRPGVTVRARTRVAGR